MDKLKAIADLLIIAFCLFYVGLSIAGGKLIIALLCAIVAVLAWNHLMAANKQG